MLASIFMVRCNRFVVEIQVVMHPWKQLTLITICKCKVADLKSLGPVLQVLRFCMYWTLPVVATRRIFTHFLNATISNMSNSQTEPYRPAQWTSQCLDPLTHLAKCNPTQCCLIACNYTAIITQPQVLPSAPWYSSDIKKVTIFNLNYICPVDSCSTKIWPPYYFLFITSCDLIICEILGPLSWQENRIIFVHG